MAFSHAFKFFIAIALLGLLGSCTDLTEVSEIETDSSGEYALPLVNTSATILDIAENTSSNASVRVDPDGRLTVLYSAEPVRREARDIFAPVEFGLPILILDTVFVVPLPVQSFPADWVLNSAVFDNVNIRWVIGSELQEDITVQISIPEVMSNGSSYQSTFVLPAGETFLNTPDESLDGWELVLQNNDLTVEYTATRPNGERILLDDLVFQFDRLDFSYIEGFFGREVNPVQGNVITVGAFSNWLSGGLWFEEPRVNIRVENSFGFPTRAEFNQIRFTTVEDNVFDLEGEFIDNGVEFDFPSLGEVGVVKRDSFVFTPQNSNIQLVFNERVARVFFDINAIGNPDNDPSIVGFITNDSYYEVFTDVEMPLNMYANDLLLTDTFDLDFGGFENIDSAEFKLVTENDFPFQLDIQGYFRSNGVTTDSLFVNPFRIEPGQVTGDGTVLSRGETTTFIPFEPDRIENATSADEMVFIVSMQSPGGEVPEWIFDNYALDLRLGAKVRLAE
jgi:hypothetical protein